ncbi:hypothetical protein TorRG33x02_310870 [Trema orientale]|uniref:Uncharacterized protein n=1 Tax=Trema orientale TaxID=63057 RepID=A0A2P5BS43_TREOI|nr:hypothetical protein TorRG33x02_310870 [Trema orientale]
MPESLDRFTTAYLLSAYGFNDFRSKSPINSDLDDSFPMEDHGRMLDAAGRDEVKENRGPGVPGVSRVGAAMVDATVDNSVVGAEDASILAGSKASSGAHRLVGSGAHGLVMSRDSHAQTQGAHGLVLDDIVFPHVAHANDVVYGVPRVKDPHATFKVINSGPLVSNQGLSFMAPKNKGVCMDSVPEVVGDVQNQHVSSPSDVNKLANSQVPTASNDQVEDHFHTEASPTPIGLGRVGSSSIVEFSASLNTSDLSPSKVFFEG